MLKSLYFKIVLILLIFIIAVMATVGAILMSGVSSYYNTDFSKQMENCFDTDGTLMSDLRQSASPYAMKNILASYGSILGIDQYRNYYILNTDGIPLAGSDSTLSQSLEITPNILAAISGRDGNTSTGALDYSDWAVRITSESEDGGDYIIYIKDSLDEMKELTNILFRIIIQAVIVGVIIAVILSFFLAKSISSPLKTLTEGTKLVASGEFSHEIGIQSEDEIGVLAESFNTMRERLRDTIEEVNGEREKLDTVLTCMRDAVVAFAADGTLIHCNNSAEELFADDFSAGELSLETCIERLDIPLSVDGNRIELTSADAAVENTRDGFIFRDRIMNSRVYDVSFAVIRYVSENSQASGCLIIIHDTTARYELDESRREFVANVSHELRTPLTSIKSATETVRYDPEMDEPTKEYFLDIVLDETDRMTSIVSDLLTLSRLDNKRTKWNIETFDVKQMLRRIVEKMLGSFEEHRHKVSFGAYKTVPEITADRQRIEQVFINIISNAIKYTPDGGHIDIKLMNSQNAGMILVKITDNGIGIPEEDVGHLFERFYRVEKSRTQDAGGTGLGLAIAKEFVAAHGGNISVESKVGVGTAISIELPVECALKTEKRR